MKKTIKLSELAELPAQTKGGAVEAESVGLGKSQLGASSADSPNAFAAQQSKGTTPRKTGRSRKKNRSSSAKSSLLKSPKGKKELVATSPTAKEKNPSKTKKKQKKKNEEKKGSLFSTSTAEPSSPEVSSPQSFLTSKLLPSLHNSSASFVLPKSTTQTPERKEQEYLSTSLVPAHLTPKTPPQQKKKKQTLVALSSSTSSDASEPLLSPRSPTVALLPTSNFPNKVKTTLAPSSESLQQTSDQVQYYFNDSDETETLRTEVSDWEDWSD